MIDNSMETYFITAAIGLGIPGGWHVPKDIQSGSLPNVTQAKYDEILSEALRLQAEYDSKQYARDRAADYPSIADQLDTLYHGGIDAWKAEVKVVKDKYPKG